MWSGKCARFGKLGPFSFGLALGITSAIAVLLWSLWVMHYGVPPLMANFMKMPASSMDVWAPTLLALAKGFIFGFFFALIYDLLLCCFHMWCKHPNGTCGCCGSGSATCGSTTCNCNCNKSDIKSDFTK